jgi:hypothetical protein
MYPFGVGEHCLWGLIHGEIPNINPTESNSFSEHWFDAHCTTDLARADINLDIGTCGIFDA